MSRAATRTITSRPGFRAIFRRRILGLPLLLDCIQVEVTSRCPGRCAYCPHTTRRADWVSRDMDLATFARLEPMLHRTGRVHLQGWGEPLLNPAFFDMAAIARRAGCAVSTTTCGLCMDDDIAAGLVASGIDIAAFSFAGTDPESNRSRAGVDFDRVCDAIGRLAAAKAARGADSPAIHLAYLLLASNLEAVRGLPALMRRLSVQGAVVSTLDYIAAPGMEADAYLPHETDKIAAAAAVLEQTAAEAERLGRGFHFELPQAAAPGHGLPRERRPVALRLRRRLAFTMHLCQRPLRRARPHAPGLRQHPGGRPPGHMAETGVPPFSRTHLRQRPRPPLPGLPEALHGLKELG